MLKPKLKQKPKPKSKPKQKSKPKPMPTEPDLDSDPVQPVEADASSSGKRSSPSQRTLSATDPLMSQAELHRHALDHLTVGLLVYDKKDIISYANPYIEQLIGIPASEVVGCTQSELNWRFYYEEGPLIPDHESPVKLAFKAREPLQDVIIGMNHAVTGERIWLLFNISFQYQDDGDIDCSIVTMTDMTSRVMTEKKLYRFERILTDIAHIAQIGAWELQLDTNEIHWSEEVRRIHEVDPDYVPEIESAIGFYAPEAQPIVRDAIGRSIKEASGWNLELPMITAKGNHIWVRAIGQVEQDHNGQAIRAFGCFQDITEQRNAKEQALQQLETVKMLHREVDHRVRNNLAGLGALIELTAKASPDTDEFAKRIRQRVQAMSSVHQLLSSHHWKPLPLGRIITDVVSKMGVKQMECTGPEILIPSRQVAAFGIVIQEMLSNSMKHGALLSETGRITLHWDRREEVEHEIELVWRETGGPTINGVPTPSLGTMLIHGFAQSELAGRAELQFPEDGVILTLVINTGGEE